MPKQKAMRAKTSTNASPGVALETALQRLQGVVDEVAGRLSISKRPPLREVQFSLQVVSERSTGWSVKILFLTLGRKTEVKRTQTVTVTMKPRAVLTGTALTAELNPEPLVSAALDAVEATSGLEVSEFTVELEFSGSVTDSGELALEPIGFGGDKGIHHSMVHILTIWYGGRD